MRRLIPISLAFTLIAMTAAAADRSQFEGSWEGSLIFRGEPLDLRLHVDTEADPGARVDYPQLVFANQPAPASISEEILEVELPLGIGSMVFRMDDGLLRGRQQSDSGEPIGAVLRRGEILRVSKETVRFGAAEPAIEGTLTIPPGDGPFPLAILLAGASNPTRGNLAYSSWTDLLARNGFASFSYDRRADDELDAEGNLYSISDHAADILAAIDILESHPSVDSSRIGLIAKSRGGWIAVASAARDPRISFLVGIGIAAVDIAQQDLQAIEAKMRASEESEENIQNALAYTRLYFHVARNPADWPKLERARQAAALKPWADRVRLPDTIGDLDWFRAQLDFEPLELISRIDAPMFLAWGASDRTTPPSMNVPLFEYLISESSAEESVIAVYEGAGHTMEGPMNTDADPEVVWGGMHQTFLSDVSAWLRRR